MNLNHVNNEVTITQEDVTSLVDKMRRVIPGFEIKYKKDSRFQKFIGWLLKPINSEYMTSYVSTMFGKIWLPSESKEWSWRSLYKIYRHEFIHLLDAQRYGILFSLSYLFLLPSIFTMRSYWEMRAFKQSMLVEYELSGNISDTYLDWIEIQFTTSYYFWMWPFKKSVRNKLEEIREQIKRGEIARYG